MTLGDRYDGFRDCDENASLKFAETIVTGMARQYNQARIDYAQELELGGRVTTALAWESWATSYAKN